MSFSCTIKSRDRELTKSYNGEPETIHYQLFGLAPNGPGSTDAPYRLSDLRAVIIDCKYGDRLEEAAQDCFRKLQMMAKENLDSLTPPSHCETCQCHLTRTEPYGWSALDIENFLKIDATKITYIHGGN